MSQYFTGHETENASFAVSKRFKVITVFTQENLETSLKVSTS